MQTCTWRRARGSGRDCEEKVSACRRRVQSDLAGCTSALLRDGWQRTGIDHEGEFHVQISRHGTSRSAPHSVERLAARTAGRAPSI